MRRNLYSKLIVGLAILMVVGAAAASNMAFKMNALILQQGSLGGTGSCTQCINPTSFPFITQFAGQRLHDICLTSSAFGSVSQPGRSSQFGLSTTVDPDFVDEAATRSCGIALPGTGVNPPYQPNAGIRILLKRPPAAGAPTSDVSYIIVGSDAPGTAQTIRQKLSLGGTGKGPAPDGSCIQCGNLVQLPYHTTATRLNDICLENTGFQSVAQAGRTSNFGLSTTVDGRFLDELASRSCGPSAGVGINPPVQIGRAVRIVLKVPPAVGAPTGNVTWSPAHF